MDAPHVRSGLVRPDARANIGLLVTISACAILAWAVPLSAVMFVWPFLFLIPGWVIIARVAPGLPTPGRIGLAVVVSVYFAAHTTNIVARIDGFTRPAVLLTAVILAAGTLLLMRVQHRWLAPWSSPSWASIQSTTREHRDAWLLVVAATGSVLLILSVNGWRQTGEGFISGGWNWSDLLVHVAIGSSIAHGNFPPDVPYFAGVPLTYHWFADFHGAIAATAAGVDVIPVFFGTSALFAGVLALLVWALTLHLTGRRSVAVIATVLVCFGGGMGWVSLVSDVAAGVGSPIDLITQHSYDNNWREDSPPFRIASILGTAMLPHRASTLGLPGLVAVVLLVVTCLGRRPAGVLVAGILAALLAPFHFYAFPAAYLIVLLFVIASGAWRARTVIRDAVLFLGPMVLAIPFIAGAALQQGERGAFRFVLGWSEARTDAGLPGVALFYITNLGIPFVLACIAVLVARTMPARGFLAAWAIALFIVPNVVVVSAVEFDMNKYFQMMWIAVAILAAWLIQSWRRPALVAVLALSALSPALVGVWHLTNPALVLTTAQERAGRWIEANTPARAVFVTDSFINSPVDISGRRRLTTFGPYAANLGYDPEPRIQDVRSIYCDGTDQAAALMTRYGATHVLSSAGGLECDPTDFSASPSFEQVYGAEGVAIWRLVGG